MANSADGVASASASSLARRVLMRCVAFTCGSLIILTCVSCKKEQSEGILAVRGAGATFPEPLYKSWIATYNAAHNDIKVSYEPVGSGEGIRRYVGDGVEAGELVDFGGSEAPLKPEQITKVTRGFNPLPMTAGSIVLAYNLPGLKGDLRLSRKAYTGIFLGEITRWNDPSLVKDNPNAELPDDPIVIVARKDRSGTTYSFSEHLSNASAKWNKEFGAAKYIDWPGQTMLAPGNEGVAGRIKRSLGSIGYVQFGIARAAGLRMAILENKAGNFIEPSSRSGIATLAAADLSQQDWPTFPDPDGDQAYPMVTLSWILLYEQYDSPEKAQAIQEFFQWCLTDGQNASERYGYIPLESKLAGQGLARLEKVRAK